jgi:hypothetical protein
MEQGTTHRVAAHNSSHDHGHGLLFLGHRGRRQRSSSNVTGHGIQDERLQRWTRTPPQSGWLVAFFTYLWRQLNSQQPEPEPAEVSSNYFLSDRNLERFSFTYGFFLFSLVYLVFIALVEIAPAQCDRRRRTPMMRLL